MRYKLEACAYLAKLLLTNSASLSSSIAKFPRQVSYTFGNPRQPDAVDLENKLALFVNNNFARYAQAYFEQQRCLHSISQISLGREWCCVVRKLVPDTNRAVVTGAEVKLSASAIPQAKFQLIRRFQIIAKCLDILYGIRQDQCVFIGRVFYRNLEGRRRVLKAEGADGNKLATVSFYYHRV
eukprot:gene35672-43264_t